jgi:AcrR family transcriptional regulator
MARPRGDIRRRVVHAARARFLADGVEGASLRAIAAAARTSIGMVYYYFPAKDDLFLAVVEEIYAELLADLEIGLARARPVADRLRALFDRLAALDDDELDVLRIVIREALVSSRRLHLLIERVSHGHVPLVVATIADGVASGALRGDLSIPVLVAGLASTAALPQIVHHLLAGQDPGTAALLPARGALADALRALYLGGAAAPAPSKAK